MSKNRKTPVQNVNDWNNTLYKIINSYLPVIIWLITKDFTTALYCKLLLTNDLKSILDTFSSIKESSNSK
jgi:hypothetical protein